MTPQVESLFHELADLTFEQRAEHYALHNVVQEVRDELERLFSYDKSTSAPMKDAIGHVAGRMAAELEETIRPGSRFGPYRLIELLGKGGMGAVYHAERVDGELTQEVALKIVRASMLSESMLLRFRNERQILAKLEHPNIARLFDGGTSDDGLPYFVMEYIRGKSIIEYCVENNLGVRERLALFSTVCDAVQHAHGNLVIHRDLKPSNILVTREGIVKLLDFGIAKVLERDGGVEDQTKTFTGATLFTPDYCSPEQIQGEQVSTATDVYGLGCVLYELLTGKRPHNLTTYSPSELVDAVCHREPAPLSSAGPAELRRTLRGDLETIVGRALRKDPRERYQLVALLRSDIDRYLAGHPISARSQTTLYRTRKFIQRHRLGVGAAAVATLLLVTTTIVAVNQAIQARNRFDQVRGIARTFMFDFYDELQKVPGTTKAKAMVISTASEYLQNLATSAGRDRGLLLELASSYERLALVEGGSNLDLNLRAAALEHRKKAVDIRSRLAAEAGQDDPRVLYLRVLLTDDLRNMRRLNEALKMGQDAVADADRLRSRGKTTPEILLDSANAHAVLGRVFRDLDQLVEAEAVMKKGDQFRQVSDAGKVTRYTVSALQDRASVLVLLGRIDEAIQLLQRAEKSGDRLISDASPGSAYLRAFRTHQITLSHLADAYDDAHGPSKEQPAAALAYRNKQCKGWEHLLSLDANLNGARAELAFCQINTALILMKIDPQGAVAMARSGLSIFESLEKATPDEINLRFRRARGAIPYATILLAVGRPLQAQEVIQSSLRTNRELVANNKESLLYQHSLVWSLTVAGEIEHALKNDEQSRKLLKDAIGMAAPFHNKLDLGLLRAAADAQFTYSKVLSGSERCEALKGIRLIWQSYKGASSPWLEGRREQATRAVNACPAAQKLVASF